MLQQTRMEVVLPYWNRFMSQFPTPEILANADEEEVFKAWAGLGYYRRARFLHRAAKVLSEERGGVFPSSRSDWESLPGIGPYTSAALASIVSGELAAVVDGNVKRVAARVHGWERSLSDPALHKETEAWAQEVLREAFAFGSSPGDSNQALMELGAMVCTPAQPQCGVCPVAAECSSRASADPSRLPFPAKKPEFKKRFLTFLVSERKQQFLMQPCKEGAWTPGFWEPPFVEAHGEEEVCRLWLERGGEGVPGEVVGHFRHTITRNRIFAEVRVLHGDISSGYESPAEVPLSGLGEKSIKIAVKHFS